MANKLEELRYRARNAQVQLTAHFQRLKTFMVERVKREPTKYYDPGRSDVLDQTKILSSRENMTYIGDYLLGIDSFFLNPIFEDKRILAERDLDLVLAQKNTPPEELDDINSYILNNRQRLDKFNSYPKIYQEFRLILFNLLDKRLTSALPLLRNGVSPQSSYEVLNNYFPPSSFPRLFVDYLREEIARSEEKLLNLEKDERRGNLTLEKKEVETQRLLDLRDTLEIFDQKFLK